MQRLIPSTSTYRYLKSDDTIQSRGCGEIDQYVFHQKAESLRHILQEEF